MKKTIKQEKKLSLNKLQIMKINDARKIMGGNTARPNLIQAGGSDDDQDPTPTPLRGSTYVK